jgi:ammonia channel protein AmtB
MFAVLRGFGLPYQSQCAEDSARYRAAAIRIAHHGIFLAAMNPATRNGLAKIVGHTLWLEQLKAIGITVVLAVVGSAIIGAIVRGLIGLRIPAEIERQGLDINQHGEEGYMTS